MTDPDRIATYACEFTLRDMLKVSQVHVHGVTVDIPVERNFATIENIQAYVDKVLALNWVRAAYPRATNPLKVVKKPKGANNADCGGGVMRVPINSENRWALREIVILHEMAHHLAPGGHAEAFRTCFAWLVSEIIAPEAGWLLRTLFWDNGLPVQTPASLV